jgi:hypothetical protein
MQHRRTASSLLILVADTLVADHFGELCGAVFRLESGKDTGKDLIESESLSRKHSAWGFGGSGGCVCFLRTQQCAVLFTMPFVLFG